MSIKERKRLESLCGFKIKKRNLLYRASLDGFEAAKFHKKCDNQSNTLTVIKSENGFVFGGFTPSPWDSSSRYKKQNNSFLFSLINESKKPEKIMINSYYEKAIYCSASYGPTFGGGHDIYISDKSNENKLSYSGGSGNSYISAYSTIAGSKNFQVLEIEVYRIDNV